MSFTYLEINAKDRENYKYLCSKYLNLTKIHKYVKSYYYLKWKKNSTLYLYRYINLNIFYRFIYNQFSLIWEYALYMYV